MNGLARLYDAIDATTSTQAKVDAMAAYFRDAPDADAAWAVHVLTGQKLKRLVPSAVLREWVARRANLEPWLFEESYAVVGDLAETATLLLEGAGHAGAAAGEDLPLAEWVESRLLSLRGLDAAMQADRLDEWARTLSGTALFLMLKLVTGSLRVGVSRTLTERAIAQAFGLEPAVVAQRLMGEWSPTPGAWRALIDPDPAPADAARPYPFFLASPLDDPPESLGPVSDWIIEWKWDGIRAQVVRRGGAVSIWSRGEEHMTERFPEIVDAAVRLPDGTVLDGELVCWSDGRVLPFSMLQRRIGRKTLGPKILREAPAALIAYDLLEAEGEDLRTQPQQQRRSRLEALLAAAPGRLILSERLRPADWAAAAAMQASARAHATEGLMLKHRDALYEIGRRRGGWWKWKVDPLTIDAVMIYAQPGHGRRANLLTDYTFAVWHEGSLTPVAKAYSGLDDTEIAEVDRWIRRHTTERFGPVRAVEPVRVFEIAFEGIARSPRHASGVALRFPRIARPRPDKRAEDADTLATLHHLIDAHAAQQPGR